MRRDDSDLARKVPMSVQAMRSNAEIRNGHGTFPDKFSISDPPFPTRPFRLILARRAPLDRLPHSLALSQKLLRSLHHGFPTPLARLGLLQQAPNLGSEKIELGRLILLSAEATNVVRLSAQHARVLAEDAQRKGLQHAGHRARGKTR